MTNIVVYESKYGSTEKYAKWIGEELNCKVCRISDISIEELKNYDNIIFGGWVHSGKLEGFKKIKSNIDKLKDKQFLIFTCGMSPNEDGMYKAFKEKNFMDLNNLLTFYLNGAFDFNRLSFVDKMTMRVFKFMLKRLNSQSSEESTKRMLRAYEEPIDFTDREKIKPIVEAVRNLEL